MGTWDFGSFENDTACDWVYDLKPAKKSLFGKLKSDPFAYPTKAITTVLNANEYIESPECDEAIAAAECIAAAISNPITNLPDEVIAWKKSLKELKPSETLVQQTIDAVNRIRNAEQSEARELWSEGQDDGKVDPQWLASIDDLLSRLSA